MGGRMVLLISGKQGSGKTTLALAVREHFGSDKVVRIRFAQPLYEMHDECRKIMTKYGIKMDLTKKDGNLLQLLGTEWLRTKIGEDTLIQCVINRIGELGPEKVIIVEDCRFENEFDLVSKAYSTATVRLECSRDQRRKRAEMWREAEDHPSEIGLDHYAAMGRFQKTLNTDVLSKEQVLKEVIELMEQHL
jgi:phosphomevalonate kinase